MSTAVETLEVPSMADISAELLGVANDVGTLTPPAVLAWAKRNKGSAVYRWLKVKNAFDQKKAAEMFALILCRQLIQRVKVVCHAPDQKPITVRAFTSLMDDRTEGAGYRLTEAVLADQELREQLLQTAKMELDALRRKYRHLQELAGVWDAIGEAVDEGRESA